jgi:hypothetical protein
MRRDLANAFLQAWRADFQNPGMSRCGQKEAQKEALELAG